MKDGSIGKISENRFARADLDVIIARLYEEDVYKRQVRSRLPVGYNPDAPAPVIWLNFLDGLLYAEDIPTLQEFIGYCLIPSNKGQRMMVIKGNGGEGKSQIGAVLSTIFGTNMKDGSIGKISENRFARADLEHILLLSLIHI